MEIQGKIIIALPEVTGVAKATGNPWKKRDYVLETHDQFPRKIAFDMFGDKADQYPMQVGDEVTLSFDIESREFNGKWYTNIRGWKAEKVGAAGTGAPQQPAYGYGQAMPSQAVDPMAPPMPASAPVPAGNPDDLPF